jgi:putative Mg2+ transporter-C (MgtC) family protein
MLLAAERIPALLPSQPELLGRLALATALGACVGVEREWSRHPAGVRTHAFVGLGSSLFAIVSAYGFASFLEVARNTASASVDVTRVASQIVVGMGFLGGGAIIKEGLGVRGLTTAASLWVTAAVGLATGLGMLPVAAGTTAIVLLVVVGLRRPTRWLRSHGRRASVMVIRLDQAADPLTTLERLRGDSRLRASELTLEQSEDQTEARIRVSSLSAEDVDQLLADVARQPGVCRVDVN